MRLQQRIQPTLRAVGHWLLAAMLCCAAHYAKATNAVRPAKAFDFAPLETESSGAANLVKGALEILPVLDGKPHQLSGLAWDADENTLYALSDDSYLVHFRPRFENGRLANVDIQAIVDLRDRGGEPLIGVWADSEGLELLQSDNGVKDDTVLLISFENKPRVERFDAAGNYRGRVTFGERKLSSLPFAHSNRMFEAVVWHSKFGVLVIPEKPLKRESKNQVPVISEGDRAWLYPLGDAKYGAVVGASMSSQQSLVVLERHFGSVLEPLSIKITESFLPQSPNTALKPRTLAEFNAGRGWPVDNFEGITRHRGECYFMVSDDNNKPWQKTLLVYLDLSSLMLPAAEASIRPSCTAASDNRVDVE